MSALGAILPFAESLVNARGGQVGVFRQKL
jgi:hypothetical protein